MEVVNSPFTTIRANCIDWACLGVLFLSKALYQKLFAKSLIIGISTQLANWHSNGYRFSILRNLRSDWRNCTASLQSNESRTIILILNYVCIFPKSSIGCGKRSLRPGIELCGVQPENTHFPSGTTSLPRKIFPPTIIMPRWTWQPVINSSVSFPYLHLQSSVPTARAAINSMLPEQGRFIKGNGMKKAP